MSESRPIWDTPTTRRQLARIRKSTVLRRRQKLIALLDYLVSETMAGHGPELNQKKIATEVFQFTSPEDDQAGVTVRTAITRLRAALQDYYKTVASADEIVIAIPPRRFYITALQPAPPADDDDALGEPEGAVSSLGKQIKDTDIIGDLGVNLIHKICLDMGFIWRATTGFDAGIDGHIEIRLESGTVTNCIIQVQSKATDQDFEAETSSNFDYRCSQRDLEYWLSGNAPVILVRSRPRTGEAYWVSIKEYFQDLARRKTGKISFDKNADRFDVSARDALMKLAMRTEDGPYLATGRKREIIYSNLLRLAPLPEIYYVAETDYRTSAELFARLRELKRSVHGEWLLHDRRLWSFHDLSARPWTEIIEPGTLEGLETSEWAQTDDPARQRHFVQLLNTCLKEKLYRKGVKFSRETGCYYFRAPQDLSNVEYSYTSREHKTSRMVFRGYPKKLDRTQMSYYRHSAFEGRFVRYAGTWYLQISPTYHFTRDGERISRYAGELLSGIKRLENNQAVHGQVVMWAHLLTARSLFDSGPQFLDFDVLEKFELDVGVDDEAWIKREDVTKIHELEGTNLDQGQVSLIV